MCMIVRACICLDACVLIQLFVYMFGHEIELAIVHCECMCFMCERACDHINCSVSVSYMLMLVTATG